MKLSRVCVFCFHTFPVLVTYLLSSACWLDTCKDIIFKLSSRKRRYYLHLKDNQTQVGELGGSLRKYKARALGSAGMVKSLEEPKPF